MCHPLQSASNFVSEFANTQLFKIRLGYFEVAPFKRLQPFSFKLREKICGISGTNMLVRVVLQIATLSLFSYSISALHGYASQPQHFQRYFHPPNYPIWTWAAPRPTVVHRYIPIPSHLSQTLQAKEQKQTFNKNRVLSFMKELFGDKNVTAIDKYIAKKYIQHNPTVPDGRDAFKAAATEWFHGATKEKLDIRRVAADGDMVWVHWRAVEGNETQAVVDIFRLQKGKIVEHWDVIQNVPRVSINNNTVF